MILVDTDVLVWALRGSESARDWLSMARGQSPLAISVVTVAELTGGMRSTEHDRVWSLLAALRSEPVTEVVARRAGEFRRRWHPGHAGIGTSDYAIAATAEVLGAELATLNVKHFPMFDGLRPPFQP